MTFLLLSLIFATFRKAVLGFFGGIITIFIQTPFFCGHASNARVLFILNFFIIQKKAVDMYGNHVNTVQYS